MREGKNVYGLVKVGERGQIVIPKKARESFGIEAGDELIIVGDYKKGLAIVKSDVLSGLAKKALSILEVQDIE